MKIEIKIELIVLSIFAFSLKLTAQDCRFMFNGQANTEYKLETLKSDQFYNLKLTAASFRVKEESDKYSFFKKGSKTAIKLTGIKDVILMKFKKSDSETNPDSLVCVYCGDSKISIPLDTVAYKRLKFAESLKSDSLYLIGKNKKPYTEIDSVALDSLPSEVFSELKSTTSVISISENTKALVFKAIFLDLLKKTSDYYKNNQSSQELGKEIENYSAEMYLCIINELNKNQNKALLDAAKGAKDNLGSLVLLVNEVQLHNKGELEKVKESKENSSQTIKNKSKEESQKEIEELKKKERESNDQIKTARSMNQENERDSSNTKILKTNKKNDKIEIKQDANVENSETLKIDTFRCAVRHGYAYDIWLYAAGKEDQRVFYCPSLVSFKDMAHTIGPKKCFQIYDKQGHKLNDLKKADLPYIILTDAIQFDNIKGKLYPPEDLSEELVLTIEGPKRDLQKDLSPGNLFNAAIYTDALALAKKETNGIVETEISIQQRPNVVPIRSSSFILMHFLRERFIFRKFDGDKGIFLVDSGKNVDVSKRRTELLQKAYFTGELSVGLINYRWFGMRQRELHRSYLNLIYSMNLTNLRLRNDSLISTSILSNNIGIQEGIILYPAKGLTLQFNYNIFSHYLTNPKSIVKGSDERLFRYLNKNNNTETDSEKWGHSDKNYYKWRCSGVAGWNFFQSFEIKVSYTPAGQAHSSMFLKWLYTDNLNTQDGYMQLQVGYSLDIADFFSKAKQ